MEEMTNEELISEMRRIDVKASAGKKYQWYDDWYATHIKGLNRKELEVVYEVCKYYEERMMRDYDAYVKEMNADN